MNNRIKSPQGSFFFFCSFFQKKLKTHKKIHNFLFALTYINKMGGVKWPILSTFVQEKT